MASPLDSPWAPLVTVAVFFLLVIVWFVRNLVVMRQTGQSLAEVDPLNIIRFHIGDMPFSSWPLTHLVMYTVLGFLFPNLWPLFFVIGVIWEIMESSVCKVVGRKGHAMVRMEGRSGQLEYPFNWWQGSWKDIVFNTAGLVIGISLRAVVNRAMAG